MRSINLDAPVSDHFTWHEVLWLPKWNRAATEEDGLTDAILDTLEAGAKRMDTVRDFFNAALNVHCWYRPPAYNKEVHGASMSAHQCLNGNWAVDFDVHGLSCQDAIQMILQGGKLTEWQLRMENNGAQPSWIHLDSQRPTRSRYFIP